MCSLFLIQLAIESLYDSPRERLRQRDYCQSSKGSDIGASWVVVNIRYLLLLTIALNEALF
jgi:hypothetical protein